MDAQSQPFVLRGGLLVDGSGSTAHVADLLVRDGRIEAIGQIGETAGTPIDCTDKVVAPGFIDAHSHMDFFAAGDEPRHFDSFTAQGVTTFVAGNCGFSPFGFAEGTPHRALLESSLFKAGQEKLDWNSFAEYRAVLQRIGLTHNFVHLAGHGATRTSLSGFEARPLTGDENALMLRILERELSDGAAGVSLSLIHISEPTRLNSTSRMPSSA